MKVNTILLQLAVATVTVGFAASAAAAMYKWTDQEGNVQYTQTPPPDGAVMEIAPPPRVGAPAAASEAKKAADVSEGDGQQADNGQEPALTPEQQEAYARNCEAAKGNLQLYQTRGRVKTPEGDIVELNDEVRQKKVSQAEEQIKKFCK